MEKEVEHGIWKLDLCLDMNTNWNCFWIFVGDLERKLWKQLGVSDFEKVFVTILCPINVVPDMEQLSQTLGGVMGTLPSVYLCMVLGAKSGSIDTWNLILEKCERN